jgi:hypothetical protein
MAFTPEQIAKAYIGAQGDIYDVYQTKAAMEAKQSQLERAYAKQQLDQDRKERAERNAALNDVNLALKNAHLATGSKLDDLYNKQSEDIYADAFNPENTQLFQTSPAAWKQKFTPKIFELNNNISSVGAGLKKVREYVGKLNQDYKGALNTTALENALIDGLAYDKNNKPTGSLNAEDASMEAITNGYYDFLNKKANETHVPDIDKAADFWNPVKTKELVVSKFKADIKPAKTKYYQDGVMMNDNYQIPAYYKIVEDKKEPVLDTNTVKTKDGDTYELATDNMKDILTGTMQEKMAIAHHARELKETSRGQEAFIALEGDKDPEAFNRYVIADFAKVLPKGYKENTEVDPGFAFKNRGTGDKKEKTKDSLEYTQSLFGQSFSDADKFPVADKRFYSQSSLPKGLTLQNFHDITSTSGDDLLKDASNISFKIWRNTEDGKDYFTIEETRGTNSVQTALSKEAERKGWQKGQFYEVPNAAFYLNFPAHKYSTDTRSLTKGAGSTTTNNPAVSVQAAATTAPATTSSGGTNWSELVKKRKEEQDKKNKKK